MTEDIIYVFCHEEVYIMIRFTRIPAFETSGTAGHAGSCDNIAAKCGTKKMPLLHCSKYVPVYSARSLGLSSFPCSPAAYGDSSPR